MSVENFSTGYSGKEVLHDLTFEISRPGIYVVLGKNGAGKTTLFRAMTGMLRAFSGSIRYNDVELGKSEVQLAYLGHRNAIPSGLTVRAAMKFFGEIEGVTGSQVDDVVNELNLKDLLTRRVESLSQGQRKRVSLAKCLMGNKDIMILDEPTANLDPKVSAEIREFMLKGAQSKTILYSSHNLYEATELGTEVIALSEGRVMYTGDISGLSSENYRIGIRGTGIEDVATGYVKEGRYYVFDLKSPSEAADLVNRLTTSGARIFEVKDLTNPLERFYDDST